MITQFKLIKIGSGCSPCMKKKRLCISIELNLREEKKQQTNIFCFGMWCRYVHKNAAIYITRQRNYSLTACMRRKLECAKRNRNRWKKNVFFFRENIVCHQFGNDATIVKFSKIADIQQHLHETYSHFLGQWPQDSNNFFVVSKTIDSN